MPWKFILFCLILICCNPLRAQVREVNFLGKIWKLNGIEYRLKGLKYSQGYFQNIIFQMHAPNENYQDFINGLDNAFYLGNPAIIKLTAIGIGVSFRPMYDHPNPLMRSMEFGHILEFERVNSVFESYARSDGRHTFTSTLVSYHPRFIIDMPQFPRDMKFYLLAEGLFAVPLRTYLYSSAPESALPSNSIDRVYKKNGDEYNYRMTGDYSNSGIGGGIGMKFNLGCRFNFHVEGSMILVNTIQDGLNYQSKLNCIQFGLRYKFGIPEDSENPGEGDVPKVFW